MADIVPVEIIESKILLLRGRKIMLDRDLAALYGVETKVLNQAVRRNIKRFPPDFMFRLDKTEMSRFLRSHLVTLKKGRGLHVKYPPLAFTEQGIAMLSGVLNSERAIEVNIAVMRAFVRLRELIAGHRELARRLDQLENKYDKQFKIVFDAIRELISPPVKPQKRIGFTAQK
jgi:hypothetical protein